ncbi:uncharacterized protein [Mytilus edulis]|uniref:uncharacterized protein n=1 Tax=Mytilus edulis TaxID=6550 RepID=UPI0039EE764E
MGGGDRCSIGICDNDRRYPDKLVKRSHVSNLQFHSLPKDPQLSKLWHDKIRQGRQNYLESKSVKICSNHFQDGERTFRCPVPTLFLNNSDLKTQKSPHKRNPCKRSDKSVDKKRKLAKSGTDTSEDSVPNSTFTLCIASTQLTRDADVHFLTGLHNTDTFKVLFDHLSMKASVIQYWKGPRQTIKEAPMRYSFEDDPNIFLKPGPGRKLRLEVELLLVMMRLREVFIETPSSLDTQAQCWSEYKHHCTIKFLVAITPNGMFSFVSNCYGGRASDKFITKDCGFYLKLEPNDQVMADRGFKIKEDLMTVQAKLAIPPSTCGSLAMCATAVTETSRIANVRIYVEQAIGRLKTFRFLKHEIPIACLPVSDDIVVTCCAICNLLDPLCYM